MTIELREEFLEVVSYIDTKNWDKASIARKWFRQSSETGELELFREDSGTAKKSPPDGSLEVTEKYTHRQLINMENGAVIVDYWLLHRGSRLPPIAYSDEVNEPIAVQYPCGGGLIMSAGDRFHDFGTYEEWLEANSLEL